MTSGIGCWYYLLALISGPDWLPRDKQHSAFWITMGNLYPCPDIVDAVLAFDPSDTEPKRILDIGK